MNGRYCISRRRLLGAGACALVPGVARAATAPPVVVELFTSQGCSSCPPADAFAAELVRRQELMTLTYHVDYWDYLGWKDTLGSAENSQRQYDYAKARGDMDVYTPQMIVNGGRHFSGSNREEVLAAIGGVQSPAGRPELAVSSAGAQLLIDVGAGLAGVEATLWVMPLVAQVSVKILKGEIAGQEIAYHNVVREIVPAGMWSGKATRVALPKDAVLAKDHTGCVALLQRGKVGEVLACARWGELAS